MKVGGLGPTTALLRLLEVENASVESRPASKAGNRAEAADGAVASGTEAAPRPVGMQLPVWLPVPLPDGQRGWVQLSVQERAARTDETGTEGSLQRVRLLWETPRLGTVQVMLEGTETRLSALFTALAAATRQAVDQELPDLRARLASAGFPDALLGSRPPVPGERLEPATEPSALLDRRM